MKIRSAGVYGFAVLATLAGAAADAAVRRVPQQYPTIQAAVDAALEGDTVRVAPGVYSERVLIADKAISLIGAGASETVIDGSAAGHVVAVSNTGSGWVTVSGFTLRNGATSWFDLGEIGAGQGGALYAESSNLVVRNNVMTGNLGCLGTTVSTVDTTITLSRNRIENGLSNASCGQQAVMLRGNRGGESVVSGNVIQNHEVTGLQLNSAGKVTVSNNIFRNNVVVQNAEYGGLDSLYTELVLTNNLFSGNAGYGSGAARISEFEGGLVRVTGNSFVGNRGDVGSSAIDFQSYQTGSFVIQQNRFDESDQKPAVQCAVQDVIDRSNLFASDPAAALGGACIPEAQ